MFLTRRARAQARARNTLREMAKQGRVLPPSVVNLAPTAYISIPALDIPALAAKYFAAMELEESADWCRCEWILHPDDGNVAKDTCRSCGQKKGHFVHSEEAEDHPFRGRRMRRGEQAEDCPVHTREGMLIYFFEWVFTRGKN